MLNILQNFFKHNTIRFLILFSIISGLIVDYLDLWSKWPLMILAVIFAPFYEWYAHKFILHKELTPTKSWMRDFQIKLHHGHHAEPDNINLQFAPPLAIITLFFQTYLFYSILCLSFTNAVVPIFSTFLYYLFYEWIHLAHHHKNYKPKTTLGKTLKEAHMQHHFHNENYNWGITNMLADYFFQTKKTSKEISKSLTAKTIAGYSKDLHQ